MHYQHITALPFSNYLIYILDDFVFFAVDDFFEWPAQRALVDATLLVLVLFFTA